MRSKCHDSKANFKKLFKNHIQCSLGCHETEDQRHTFINCKKIPKNLKNGIYEDIFGSIREQNPVIQTFAKIDLWRKHTKKNHLLPGGGNCQDPCTFGYSSNGAADFISS